MNSKDKAVLIFVVCIKFGSAATFTVIGEITQPQFATQYSSDVTEQAILAIELRTHQNEEIAKRIETHSPSYILDIHQNKELRDAPNAQPALWWIEEFYTLNSIIVPGEISSILNDLPPEPLTSCSLK
jgi:hypothetical protein